MTDIYDQVVSTSRCHTPLRATAISFEPLNPISTTDDLIIPTNKEYRRLTSLRFRSNKEAARAAIYAAYQANIYVKQSIYNINRRLIFRLIHMELKQSTVRII
jgi:hypothetical protein